MRIDRLDLTAFGPFTDVPLDLSGGGEGGGLHLIYGPNEAGKSSALRAIQQFFRGIDPRSTDNFLHEHKRMQIGIVLRNRAGLVENYVRRKGVKNTLLGSDGKAFDDGDACLTRWLGGIKPEEYARKFVIDHDELIAGGKEVLSAGGDLGRVLFASASGLVGLGEALRQLDDEADQLFKKGGKVPRINADLAELERKKKATKDAALKSSEWIDHDRKLRVARARKETLGRELAERERERMHLKRLAESFAPIAQRATILEELASLTDVPMLAADFSAQLRESLATLKPAEKREAEARREIASIREELAALMVPEDLLAQGDAIERIHLQIGVRRKSEGDRVRLTTERLGFEAKARAACQELGHDPSAIDFNDMRGFESLWIRVSDRAEIQELSNSRQALFLAREESARNLLKQVAKQEAAAAKVATLGLDRDNKALNKALKGAQKPGDLESTIAEVREKLARDSRKAESDLKKLGHWSGPLEAVDSLQVPPAETIERFDQEFKAAGDEETDLVRKLDALDAEARQGIASLEKLRLSGDVPTEEALEEARRNRDALWQEIRLARECDAARALVFEAATRAADEISDRLRREAKSVSDRANLIADQGRQMADRKAISARLEQARARLQEIKGRWEALWSPLKMDSPLTPREMAGWSQRLAKLADVCRSLREARESLESKEVLVEFHRRALAEPLIQLGEPAGEDDETLADRIERAQGVSKSIDHEASDRKGAIKEIDKHELDRSELENKSIAASASWEEWTAAWAAAMARIGQGPDVSPKKAVAILEQTDRLFESLNQAKECHRKLDEAAREACRFTTDVRDLTVRVAPDLVPDHLNAFDAEAAIAELNRRLGRGRIQSQKRDAKLEELRKYQEAAALARDEVIKVQARLEALRREARCDSDDALPSIIERSTRRQELERKLKDLDEKLHVLAAGTPLEGFLAEAAAAATDPEALPPRIVTLGDRIGELHSERESLDQTIGGEKTLLDRWNGDSVAAEAGQEAEDLRSRIKFEVEQYARLRLASSVLRAGIERYREKAHGPVVERASTLFSILTLGSFTGLKVDYDDRGELVLVGARGDGKTLEVGAMSLGTADQLYLALRLATLEVFLEGREPVPLIVDDILIQFDDARTSATLKILAELAGRTQVLVFTHHEHLRVLARETVPSALLETIELPGPTRVSPKLARLS